MWRKLLVVFVLGGGAPVAAQPERVVLSLRMNRDARPAVFIGLRPASEAPSGRDPALTLEGPGGLRLRVEWLDMEKGTCRLRLAPGGGRSQPPGDDRSLVLRPGGEVVLPVWRPAVKASLPYLIRLDRRERAEKGRLDRFSLAPRYQAEGALEVGGRSALLVLRDLDANGVFDRGDFGRGTSVGLDRNGDGRIWGRDEHLYGDQIIRFGGRNLEIASLAPDGSSVTLVSSRLAIPEVGKPVPAWTLELGRGATLDWRRPGKPLLLYLWDSR